MPGTDKLTEPQYTRLSLFSQAASHTDARPHATINEMVTASEYGRSRKWRIATNAAREITIVKTLEFTRWEWPTWKVTDEDQAS